MVKFYEKHEFSFCMILIIFYIVINSICLDNFGQFNYKTALVNTLFSLLLIAFMKKLKGLKYYGLTKVKNIKKYLYFIPLILISSVNLWTGININNTFYEVIFFMITMINVGFIEEVIFRGFLFKMMEKDNVKTAIIVSSITFGIGHIVNLFTGADIIPTLIQICYATSIGYLFVIIFYKSKSLLPCIITHSIVNSLSVFNTENFVSIYIVPVFLIIVPLIYAVYINKNVKKD